MDTLAIPNHTALLLTSRAALPSDRVIPRQLSPLPDLDPDANATAGAPSAPTPESDVATLVTYALVDLLADDRLRLHLLLRDYAATQLKGYPIAEADALGEAAFTYWLTYAQAHPGYEGMDALEAEARGLMGALTWAHDHARHRKLLALAHALGTAWNIRGRRAEELRTYEWAVAATQALDDAREQLWAAHQQAATYSQLGRLAEARAGHERALAFARQLGRRRDEADELHGLAVLDGQTGRLTKARAGYARALALAQQLGNPDAEAIERMNLGVFMAGRENDLQGGRASIMEALALFTSLGDVLDIGKCHDFLGQIDEDSDKDAAREHYQEALRCYAQVESPRAEDVRRRLRRLGA